MEILLVKGVDGGSTDRETMDGRLTVLYPISSPGAFGPGELKIAIRKMGDLLTES